MSTHTSRQDRDPDPAPADQGVVTDFSDIWKLGIDAAAPDPEPDVTVAHVRHTTERVEMDVPVTVRIGRHSWVEDRHLTQYRTVKPEPVTPPKPHYSVALFDTRYAACAAARAAGCWIYYGTDAESGLDVTIARDQSAIYRLEHTRYNSIWRGAIMSIWWTRMRDEFGGHRP